MNDKFAAIELTNLHFMIREMSMSIYSTIGHQMGFNIANYNLVSQLSIRKVIKNKMRNKVPRFLWNFMRKVYYISGGKKWLS
jgi:hypothetical protein